MGSAFYSARCLSLCLSLVHSEQVGYSKLAQVQLEARAARLHSLPLRQFLKLLRVYSDGGLAQLVHLEERDQLGSR